MSNTPIPAIRPNEVLEDCWHCGIAYVTKRASGGLCFDCWSRWIKQEFILPLVFEQYEVICLKRATARLLDETEAAGSDLPLTGIEAEDARFEAEERQRREQDRREAQEEANGTQH